MSVNPFDSVMRSRAAFDAGHHSNPDVVNGLSQARFDSYADGGQQPLSYGSRDQGLAPKVGAPPLTLDFGTKTEAQVNLAGILKARQAHPETLDLASPDVVPVGTKAPETVALKAPEAKAVAVKADDAKTLDVPVLNLQTADLKRSEAGSRVAEQQPLKRTPALSLAEFSSLEGDATKFQDANYDLSIKHTDKGSVFKHTYTAKDFSTCTLSNDGESIHACVSDRFARKQYEESVTDGKSTVTRYSYDDSGARKAMIPCVKEVSGPNGIQVVLYDKFGKVIQACSDG